jgi:hypothetical protein
MDPDEYNAKTFWKVTADSVRLTAERPMASMIGLASMGPENVSLSGLS